MTKILISISNFYQDVSTILLDSSKKVLKKNNLDYEQVIVPGAFELPSSINMGLETFEYSGIVALGCVIKGETSHYDIVTHECARAIQDISIYYSIPLGFGVLTVDNKQQALDRAAKYAANAANACIQMIKVKEQFMIYNDKRNSRFN